MNDADGSFTGVIADGIGTDGTIWLRKIGAGVLTLSGANTYSNSTEVAGGTLLVTNTSGSATGTGDVYLTAGTLGGSGIITGTVYGGSTYDNTIAPSATLDPDTTTTLTLGGLTASSHTILAFNLASPISNGASSNDVIVISNSGGLNLTTRPHLAINGHGYGVSSLGYYKAIQYNGTITGLAAPALISPTVVNYIAYVTYIRAADSGFIDIHRGFQGDANDDGTVDGIDLGILGGNFFVSGKDWSGADFNGDTNVNSIDMGILSGNYFNTLNESGMQMMMMGSANDAHPQRRGLRPDRPLRPLGLRHPHRRPDRANRILPGRLGSLHHRRHRLEHPPERPHRNSPPQRPRPSHSRSRPSTMIPPGRGAAPKTAPLPSPVHHPTEPVA